MTHPTIEAMAQIIVDMEDTDCGPTETAQRCAAVLFDALAEPSALMVLEGDQGLDDSTHQIWRLMLTQARRDMLPPSQDASARQVGDGPDGGAK